VTTAVYVSNADSGDISVLSLNESRGTLQTLQTLRLGGTVMPLALSPDGCRLFAARRSEPLAVVTMDVGAASGRLSILGEGPLPASMAYIATDGSGRWLLGASYGEHVVAVSRIGDDGTVGPAHQVLRTGDHAHAIRCDGSNRFAFSTALGAGVVHQWCFDAQAGRLHANPAGPQLAVHAGAGPRHLELHPNGRHAYLLNELDATLDVLSLDAERGTLAPLHTLATLPDGFVGKPWAADVHLRPDARFLYTSERTSSTIAGFAVEDDGAGLRPIGHWEAPAQPRGFHVTASGRWMLVAGQRANGVALFAIDQAAGRLVRQAEHAVGANPNWVETLATGRS
jgi:6-phosphogluconolactonase